MIDQDIVRGKTENGGSFAAFTLHIDADRLFSEYGMEYIRKTVKLLLTESFLKKSEAEVFDARIRETIEHTMEKAAHKVALAETKKLIESGPEELSKMMYEIMEGSDKE